MIRSFKRMQGMPIKVLDGEIGKLKDMYFDDNNWTVQYFVVALGSWFSGKDVLVPPATIAPFDGISLKVQLTKAELQACPHADSAIPVSLQQRYNVKSIFNMVYTSGNFMSGGPMLVSPVCDSVKYISEGNPHLRSSKSVSTYQLVAHDGEIGAIKDILFDDSFWLIRFIVAKVNNIEDCQERLFGPQIIEDIEWSLAIVRIAGTRNQAHKKPHFDASRYLDTSYEVLVENVYNTESTR